MRRIWNAHCFRDTLLGLPLWNRSWNGEQFFFKSQSCRYCSKSDSFVNSASSACTLPMFSCSTLMSFICWIALLPRIGVEEFGRTSKLTRYLRPFFGFVIFTLQWPMGLTVVPLYIESTFLVWVISASQWLRWITSEVMTLQVAPESSWNLTSILLITSSKADSCKYICRCSPLWTK